MKLSLPRSARVVRTENACEYYVGKQLRARLYLHGNGKSRDVWFGSGSEHPTELREFVRGNLHGREQWWCTTTRVHTERSWFEGKLHGIERQWSGSKLDRGYPRFHIHDHRVTRAAYLRAAISDPTLVPYRALDDRPKRTLPLPIHGLAEKRWTR